MPVYLVSVIRFPIKCVGWDIEWLRKAEDVNPCVLVLHPISHTSIRAPSDTVRQKRPAE